MSPRLRAPWQTDKNNDIFHPANRARWGRYFNTLMLLYESPSSFTDLQREANDHAEFNILATLFQG
jgi:hypothetical protein